MNRTLLFFLIVFTVVSVGLVKKAFPPYEQLAAKRVENMLNGMKEGGTGVGLPAQTAMCLWAANKVVITDRDLLTWASDNFDKWRREKKLYRKIDSYAIVKAEMVPLSAKDKPVARVVFDVEGKNYTVEVPKDQPIRWVK